MVSDKFEREMTWIEGLTGEARVKAGMVVAWQAILTTLNELVKLLNTIHFSSDQPDSKRDRQTQIKKLIIGILHEMVQCLDSWSGKLNGVDLLDEEIKDKKMEFMIACKKFGLGNLNHVRNEVAFHFAKSMSNPDTIVDAYRMIDQKSFDSINEIVRTANDCGLAMRDKIMGNMA
jgi:hypothetical protein